MTADASSDYEGDGFDDIAEYGAETDPKKADTDDDGLDDGEEVTLWESQGSSWDADIDGDGVVNLLDPDSDGDDIIDGEDANPVQPVAEFPLVANEVTYLSPGKGWDFPLPDGEWAAADCLSHTGSHNFGYAIFSGHGSAYLHGTAASSGLPLKLDCSSTVTPLTGEETLVLALARTRGGDRHIRSGSSPARALFRHHGALRGMGWLDLFRRRAVSGGARG